MADLTLDSIKKNKGITLKVTKENLISSGAITQSKADIAWHFAKRKVIIGGKGTGKTHIPNIKAVYNYETNSYFNAFGFRKYKEAAYDALGSYFSATVSILKQRGFDLRFDYEMRSYNFYRLKNKRNMMANQVFRFGSLDNASGSTDGKAPGNGGFFGLISIDEPVVEADMGNPDKIPSEEKFEQDMFIIRDNLERYNDTFEEVFVNEPKPFYEEFFTMNDWGDHPLTIAAQKFFPVEDFFKFNFGYDIDDILGNTELIIELFDNEDFIKRLIKNNTMSMYDKETDTLYSRMTKFANPNNLQEKRVKPLIEKIKKALGNSDMNKLAILMGYRHEGNVDDKMKVYSDEIINNMKTNVSSIEDLEKDGWKLSHINYAWDIDTSRVLTLTPTALFKKMRYNIVGDNKIIRRTLIDSQIEIPANGSGTLGELNDVYINFMEKTMTKHYNNLKHKPEKVQITIDDKRKWFLHEIFKKKIYFVNNYKTAEQHGMFDIQHRQDCVINGINNGMIYNHYNNKALVNDMKVCIKRDIKDSRRKTSGSTNYLDRIDSFEYGIEPYTSIIWKGDK